MFQGEERGCKCKDPEVGTCLLNWRNRKKNLKPLSDQATPTSIIQPTRLHMTGLYLSLLPPARVLHWEEAMVCKRHVLEEGG